VASYSNKTKKWCDSCLPIAMVRLVQLAAAALSSETSKSKDYTASVMNRETAMRQ
jgi:hypothetical protein